MYSNSDDDSFVQKQQRKKIRGRQTIDSDSDSDATNDSEHSSLTESPSKRTSARRSANSDTGSHSNTDSESTSLNSNSTKSKTNANDSSIRVTSGSSGGTKKNKKFVIDSNSGSEDYGSPSYVPSFDQSKDNDNDTLRSQNIDSESNSFNETANSSLNQNLVSQLQNMSISKKGESIIPETDDEEELSMIQCYSPRTRRSITGRRSKHFKISYDESDIFSDDASNEKGENSTQERPASTDSQKRSRNLALSFAQDDSIVRTPNAKKRNSHRVTHSSPSTSGEVAHSNNASVVVIESSDEESVKEQHNFSIDFSEISSASTPESRKVLVQPKLHTMLKVADENKNYVSQAYYDKNIDQLDKLKADLAHSNELFTRMAKTLPDHGQNIKRRISQLERDIHDQEVAIGRLIVEEDEIQPKIVPAAKDSWKTGIGAIKPKHTGAQGLSTFNHQKKLTLDRLEKLHRVLEECPPDEKLADHPDNLKISLMPHQLHALEWMNWREKTKPRGGILADDMGLGKTLTVIALVLDTKYKKSGPKQAASNQSSDEEDDDDDSDGRINHSRTGHTLIICPASLINQWEKEIENRVKRGKLSILMHHGNNRKSSAYSLEKYDLVITTYGVISSEAKVNGVLYKIKWERIVLDEAHMIRNHTTAMAQGCCKLRGVKRWGLTGTPIQNKEMDVYSMLKFLKITPFHDLATFKRWINVNTNEGIERLNHVLKPLLLRRTKAQLQLKGELQSLPEKSINTIQIELSKDEKNVYAQILLFSQTLFARFMQQRNTRDEGFVLGSRGQLEPDKEMLKRFQHFKQLQGGQDVKSSQILVLLLRLRQICDHPGLIDQMLEDECNFPDDDSDESSASDLNILQQMIAMSISENADENINEGIAKASQKILLRTNPVFDMSTPSSKCKKVIELVKDTLNSTSDKVVIVSQWTSVLNLVAKFLHRDGIKYVELNGKTPIKLRNDIIVNFNNPNSNERVMMLSLVAGGVGLNLAGANHLVLIDPHWNPQLEAQAFDRVFRVGQTKPVQIYKLICAETVEKHIQDIQERKLILSENVLTGSNKSIGSKLTFQDMCRLFEML